VRKGQTDNLYRKLRNLTGLIERHKDAVPEELLNAATAAKKPRCAKPKLPLVIGTRPAKELKQCFRNQPNTPAETKRKEQSPPQNAPRRSKKSKKHCGGAQ